MNRFKVCILIAVLIGQAALARVKFELPESGITMAFESVEKSTKISRIFDPGMSKNNIAQQEKIFGAEYLPLTANMGFKFKSNAGETIATVEQDNRGVAITYDAPNFTYKQSLFKTDKGIYLTRTETSALIFFGNDISYPEPVLRIPFPLKAGDSWQWEGLETEDEDTTRLTIRGKALGEEIIETSGGKFSCLRIELEVSSENGSQNKVNEWFAPGIGLVKSHAKMEGSGITYILQKMLGLNEITFELEAYGDLASLED